ncbi:MAG: 1-acyl-sn-glycerol-3-phosphate acyltransferase [Bacteroidaceae bacterium]
MGWTISVNVPNFNKCIICAVPHTSNWDLLVGKVFYKAIGRRTYFMMKSSWFFWPLGVIFKKIGGIPVYRSKKTSSVEQIVHAFKERNQFALAITPEGTRRPNPNWKKGFYFMALNANVPIILARIDYKKKEVSMDKYIIPTKDYKKDLLEIKTYYKDATGKNPEWFDLGDISGSK